MKLRLRRRAAAAVSIVLLKGRMFGFRALGSRPFENGKETLVGYRGTPHLSRGSIIRVTLKKTAKQNPIRHIWQIAPWNAQNMSHDMLWMLDKMNLEVCVCVVCVHVGGDSVWWEATIQARKYEWPTMIFSGSLFSRTVLVPVQENNILKNRGGGWN